MCSTVVHVVHASLLGAWWNDSFFFLCIAVQFIAPQASNLNCIVVVESLLSAFVALSASFLGCWWGGLVLGGWSRHP